MKPRLIGLVGMVAALVVTAPIAALAQSPSAPPPSAAPSPASSSTSGSAPTGWTFQAIPAPLDASSRPFEDAATLPDGTFVALAEPQGIGDNVLAWTLAPGASEVALAALPRSDDAWPQALAPLGDGLVAAGSGAAWQTVDGLDWSPLKAPKLKRVTPSDGVALDGQVLAVASIPGKASVGIVRSSDGRAWKTIPLTGGGGQLYPDRIAAGSDGAVVVSAEEGDGTPHVWTSTDGVAFQPAALAFDQAPWNTVRGVAWGPAGPVLVAGLEDGSRYVIDVALDGTTFTQVYESVGRPIQGQSLVRLAPAAGGGLFAVGDGMVLTSPDGRAWTATEVPEIAGIGVSVAAALPDGRVVLGTWDETAGPGLVVATPTF